MIRLITIILVAMIVYFILKDKLTSGKKNMGGRDRGPIRDDRWSESQGEGSESRQPGEMIQDPVCGAYVEERSAVTANRDGEKYYFCSTECRDRFLGKG